MSHRNAAVEQERAIKENELNTEIAVENKKRQIREAKLNADRALQEKRQLMKQDEVKSRILIEEEKKELVSLAAENKIVIVTRETRLDDLIIRYNTPDPERWDGILLPYTVGDLGRLMPDVLNGKRGVESITMAKATLSDSQTLYAVNNFYIGARTHVSSRYNIEIRGVEENHSSSGIIVSTGLGSSGWLKSVIAGAQGITGAVLKKDNTIQIEETCAWDADHLYFSVREPFPSRTTSASLVFGKIKRDSPMFIVSKMPGNGVIFSDGIENDFIEFNSGVKAVVSIAGRGI